MKFQMKLFLLTAVLWGCCISTIISYSSTSKRYLLMSTNPGNYRPINTVRSVPYEGGNQRPPPQRQQHRQVVANQQLSGKELTKYVCDNISLAAVMKKYLTLDEYYTTAGNHKEGDVNYKCLCPFHNDGNPSMMVNEGPGYYYCFSCGASGNVISFLAHMNQVPYSAARDNCLQMLESTKWMRQGSRLTNVEGLATSGSLDSQEYSTFPRDESSPRQIYGNGEMNPYRKGINGYQDVSRSSKLRSRPLTEAEVEIASVLKSNPSQDDMLSASAKKKAKEYLLSADRAKTIFKEASKYFTARLLLDPDATFVRNYLKKRGISVATAMKYQFGYASCVRQLKRTEKHQGILISSNRLSEMPVITSQACKQANISMPSWMDMRYQDLTAYLSTHSQGQFATKEEIVLSGLSINGSSYADGSSSIKRSIYDRFRYRLMIPIRNIDGEVIAFGGRELNTINPLDAPVTNSESEEDKKSSKIAKYVNSPSSAVFQKNQVLFNIDIAKDYAKSSNFVIMVEGYFDVISLHEAGIKNVVASMGTSVTINQLLAAASLSNSGTIVLLLDGDEAGLLASERVTKILEKFESELKKRQQLVIEGQAALPILPKPVAKPKPWKKLLDDSKDQIQSPVEQSITVRVASLANVTSFAEGNHLVPKTLSSDQVSNIDDESRSQLYANMKIKDCADICEVFTSHDAKKIMREVVNAATALKTIRWKRGDQLVSDD